MKLKILLPSEVLVDEQVGAVMAIAPDGAFTLLPHHIDFTSALVPSILSFRAPPQAATDERESFVAVDGGILVKKGSQVLVSTRHGVRSNELKMLHRTVIEDFTQRDRRERKARSVLAHLEANFVKRFIELEGDEGRL